MSEIEIEPKNILKATLFGGIGLILVSLFFMSWTDVNPGEEYIIMIDRFSGAASTFDLIWKKMTFVVKFDA